jgi:hypothetical protein
MNHYCRSNVGGEGNDAYQLQRHPSPILRIIGPVASNRITPPMPEPAALIPLARLRLRKTTATAQGHWECR